MAAAFRRTRFASMRRILLVAAAAWTVVAAVSFAPSLAQDDLEAAKAAAAADGQNIVPPAAPGAAAAPAAAPPRQSLLGYYFQALGIRYTVIFLGLSFIFVALLVMNFLSLRRSTIVPNDLVEGFESHLNEKRYQEAYDLAKNDDSFLGHVLSAGLAKLSTGYPQAIEAMQEVGEEETMKLEHRLGYIGLIGTISPMFGLLGTVDGMVQSFQVIANSNTQPKPSELAQGISMALVTTLIGLWLAIPALIAFGIMKNWMQQLVLEVGIVSEGLMSRFQKKQ